jgi:hypothetical protein
MSKQHNEAQPPMPPPLAIPGGFVGTHFFGFLFFALI